MNLEQNVRWQHVVLIPVAVGLVISAVILVAGLTASEAGRPPPPPPWWIGAVVLAVATALGAFALVSLRAALARAAGVQRLAREPFEVPASAPESLASLNARLASHFGLPAMPPPLMQTAGPTPARPAMPVTFGALVAATSERVRASALIRPRQHEAARSALADVLGIESAAVFWGSNPLRLIPAGRQRYALWERLRAAAPTLPEAKLNPWVENIAIYGFLAALIAIAVPLVQRFDASGAGVQSPAAGAGGAGGRLVGKALGWIVFGSIIAVLMIPVHLIGRRYAARLPAEVDEIGALARHFSRDTGGRDDDWTPTLVAEHLRDLVSTELGIPPANVRDDTPLGPAAAVGRRGG